MGSTRRIGERMDGRLFGFDVEESENCKAFVKAGWRAEYLGRMARVQRRFVSKGRRPELLCAGKYRKRTGCEIFDSSRFYI